MSRTDARNLIQQKAFPWSSGRTTDTADKMQIKFSKPPYCQTTYADEQTFKLVDAHNAVVRKGYMSCIIIIFII